MNPSDQEMHERLCEFLFGELDEAGRREVEAELERSPELRAERERLEATVGLVQQALPAEELSEEVQETLRAAAARGPRRARFHYLRGGGARVAAAAVVLLVGGLFVLRSTWMDGAQMGEVARAPEESPYVYDILGDKSGLAKQDAPQRQLQKLEREQSPADGTLIADPVMNEEVLDQLQTLGYGGESDERAAFSILEPAESNRPDVALLAAKPSAPAAVSAPTGRLVQADTQNGSGGKYAARKNPRGERKKTKDRLGDLGYLHTDQEVAIEEPELREYREPWIKAFDDDRDEGLGIRAGRRLLQQEEVTELADELLAGTRLRAGETPTAMFFRNWGVNPFVLATQDNQSTFGIDVDTASYTLARRMLNNGIFPTVDQIRTEEFVNYFKADQPAPTEGDVFAIGLELAPSLFGSDPDVDMLRVTVRGKDVDAFDRQPLALTFVVDVSGSMKDGGRLELVKEGMLLLLSQLSTTDSVAVIAFSKDTQLVSPMMSAGTRGPIEDAIHGLTPDGGTNVEAGLKFGFEIAAAHLTPHAVNRVILFSDGVGNIGETDQNRILEQVDGHRELGIYLNTFGVGLGNHDETFLEQLANRGDGICQYIDSAREAERALVQGFTQAMQPIARDVKIQVEFDPAQVESYRLLGYENRAIADHLFRDDKVDAGEVNAGHQVTALYELVRTSSASGSLATVRVRYKSPFAVDRGVLTAQARLEAEKAVEIERSIGAGAILSSFAGASAGYRRSVLVAQFAELLKRSRHARGDSPDVLLKETVKLEAELRDPDFTEFLGLVKLATPQLKTLQANDTDELTTLLDRLSELHFEIGQLELLAEEGEQAEDAPVKEALEAEIEQLELAVRDLMQHRHAPQLDSLEEIGYSDEDR